MVWKVGGVGSGGSKFLKKSGGQKRGVLSYRKTFAEQLFGPRRLDRFFLDSEICFSLIFAVEGVDSCYFKLSGGSFGGEGAFWHAPSRTPCQAKLMVKAHTRRHWRALERGQIVYFILAGPPECCAARAAQHEGPPSAS